MKALICNKSTSFLYALLLVSLLGMAGCASTRHVTDKFNLQVIFDPSVGNDWIPVDLIGIKNQEEKDRLMSIALTNYFDPFNTSLRDQYKNYAKTYEWGKGTTSATNYITKNDPIWTKEWSGATHLIVLASLTGENVNDGQRRTKVCLDHKVWDMTKTTLLIQVSKGKVSVLNSQKKDCN